MSWLTADIPGPDYQSCNFLNGQADPARLFLSAYCVSERREHIGGECAFSWWYGALRSSTLMAHFNHTRLRESEPSVKETKKTMKWANHNFPEFGERVVWMLLD